MTTAAQREDQREALDQLRALIHPGDTVYTVLRHVSASGMTRWISVLIMSEHGPRDVSRLAARALGWSFGTRNHDGIEVGGCGMDMGFHLAYSLSYALYGGESNGYICLDPGYADKSGSGRSYGASCPSNYHCNGGMAGGEPVHHDGYAVRQRWL